MSPALPTTDYHSRKGWVRILVSSGASGGHLFPALGFIQALKERQPEARVLLVVPSAGLKAKALSAAACEIMVIPVPALKGLNAGFKFLLAAARGALLLGSFKPDIVVGFGGLSSVPLLIWAWLFRIRTVIHEQNVIPGRANRLLAWFADRIAVSFPESRSYLKLYAGKTVVTGNPLRRNMQALGRREGAEYFSLDPDRPIALVMGGSQGSRKINSTFLKVVSLIADRKRLQVIHLTGEAAETAPLEQGYRSLNIDFKLSAFLEQMRYAYAAADLVVSRAGATSIAEMIFWELPAILIPYPYACQHQMANAKALEGKGCALIIKDEELSAGALSEAVQGLINNPSRLMAMREGYKKFKHLDAPGLFSEAVLSL